MEGTGMLPTPGHPVTWKLRMEKSDSADHCCFLFGVYSKPLLEHVYELHMQLVQWWREDINTDVKTSPPLCSKNQLPCSPKSVLPITEAASLWHSQQGAHILLIGPSSWRGGFLQILPQRRGRSHRAPVCSTQLFFVNVVQSSIHTVWTPARWCI